MSTSFGSGTRAAFQAAAVVASMPYADNTPIDVRQVGLFTTLERACNLLRTSDLYDLLRLERTTQRLLFVRAAERTLGGAESDVRGWFVLSARGELLRGSGEQGSGLAIGDTPRRQWSRGDVRRASATSVTAWASSLRRRQVPTS